MAIKNKAKKEETLLFIVGSILLIISFLLFHYEKIVEVSNNIYTEIKTQIYKESTSKSNLNVNISVDYLEKNEDNKTQESNYTQSTPNYIAYLEIDKIGLRQGLMPKESRYNNVNYHVEILSISDYPDKINGNFILAGHSGTGGVAYFRNLYKLNIGDMAKVYYQGNRYKYKIVNIYKEDKDGSINVIRDLTKTTLTLITCTKDDKTHQTVYILELVGVESY